MKKILGLVGVAAACGVCCAFPLMVPLLGGLAASGLGFALGWEAAVLAGLAAIAVLVVLLRRRQSRAAACSAGAALSAPQAPGCGSSCECNAGPAT